VTDATTRRPLVVAALLLAIATSAMEATVVATAMPTIVGDLGGIRVYGWVAVAYLLAATVSVPLYGRLADLKGRKPVLIAGIVLFLVGSIACGLAPSIEVLIAARALQGLGAGAMQPVSLTIVGDLFRVEERAKVQGLFGAVWGVSGIAGPILGALIVESMSWHWVFFINVPLGIASAVILSVALRENVGRSGKGALDFGGAAILAGASVLLLLGAEGKLPFLTLPAGIVLGIVFTAVESRVRAPILPLALFARRQIAVATLSSLFLGVMMMGTLIYVPLYVQGALGGTPAEAGGVVIAPMMVGWPLAATTTSRFLVRVGYRRPVIVGGVLCVIALAALALALYEQAPFVILGATTFLFGCGMGLVNTALLVAIQSSVQFNERGVTTALNMFARMMGGTLGVGALGGFLALRLEGTMSPEAVAALLAHEPGVVLPDAAALAEAMWPLFPVVAAASVLNLMVLVFWPSTIAMPAAAPVAESG
jgi:EmrB/QacA subfamily drug resistance transporter